MKTTDIPLSTFAAAGADLDLGGCKLSNVGDPAADQDAATRAYVDGATNPVRSVSPVSSQTTLSDAEVMYGLVLISGAVQVTLPDAGANNEGADLYVSADAAAALICSDGFHGMGASYDTLTFAAGEGCHVYSDGADWYLLGCGPNCTLS